MRGKRGKGLSECEVCKRKSDIEKLHVNECVYKVCVDCIDIVVKEMRKHYGINPIRD